MYDVVVYKIMLGASSIDRLVKIVGVRAALDLLLSAGKLLVLNNKEELKERC